MSKFDDAVGQLFASVEAYVGRAVAALSKRVDDLALTVSALQLKEGPTGPRGEKGDPGEPGASGAQGPAGETGAQGEPGHAGATGEPGAPGPAGADGAPGAAGAQGERGADGAPGAAGKDGDPGPAGEKGADGREGKDGRDGRDGKDGAPGRDAADIVAVPEIRPDKSYPQGTFATCYGGMLFATRDTDPLTDGSGPKEVAAAGWRVVMNGIKSETFETEGRTTTRSTMYTDGRESTIVTKSAAMEYRGVWREGEYERGDTVTWGGSVWHCEAEKTAEKPDSGTGAWKLAVKRGQDGKDRK